MIIFYKVTYHRLDKDDSQVFGYQSIKEAYKKFDDLLAGAYDSDVPLNKYVIRLGEVKVGSDGYYKDKLVEIY